MGYLRERQVPRGGEDHREPDDEAAGRRSHPPRRGDQGTGTESAQVELTDKFLEVTDNRSCRARLAQFFRTRGVRFWAITITAVSVVVLFAGSQIAHDRGQTVDWYTGFGQWLGALGSFVAAGAALWISVSDRRYNMAERQRAEDQQEADRERQAGLVRVTAEMLGQSQAVGPSIATPSIGIRNRRTDRIYDIEVTKYIHRGQEVDLVVDMVNGFTVSPPRPSQTGNWYLYTFGEKCCGHTRGRGHSARS